MSKKDFENDSKKLMTELDDLVNFLADGPEAQQEMRLGQNQLFKQRPAVNKVESAIDGVPILMAPLDSEKPIDNTAEINQEIEQIIDEVVDKLVPRLELELRRRLHRKISKPSNLK